MKVLSVDKEFQRKYRVPPQKGVREKLLCIDCEGKISKWERYASQILFHNMPKSPRSFTDAIVLPGVDYKTFKLFQLSLLWRAGVSNLPEFRQVELGPHEEKIRLMILDEIPGRAYEYGCAITRSKGLPEGLTQLIMMPEMLRKIHSHRCVRFVLNGLFWIYFISSHTKMIPYPKIFLTENGELPIMWDHDISHGFYRKMAVEFANAGLLNPKV